MPGEPITLVLPGGSASAGQGGGADAKPVSPRLDVPAANAERNSRRQSGSSANAWQQDGDAPRVSTNGAQAKPANTRKSHVRQALAHSSWYHSPFAEKLREILHGKAFALIMVLALLLALFMTDIWVVAGVNSNTGIDVVLSIVAILFTIEMLGLSLVDAGYLFSFFQVMDLVGTLSMIFDISFMLGTDATLAKDGSGDADAKKNLMLLRASRAAKIGARAGRLSRVLRILRFLPLLAGANNGKVEDAKKGIASMISGQLANLLATRVACLTIILVMVIPLFDIWTFPQTDYSLQTWVERLATNVQDCRLPGANGAATFDMNCGREKNAEELGLMATFYERYPYGPYRACEGKATTEPPFFECEYDLEALWTPILKGPPREASALITHTDDFMVAFNMHQPAQLEAGLAMATIIFIIFLMIFSGLALSSVVTELAVRPLERMLATVRQIASTVFKFSEQVQTEDDEAVDIDSSNEMKLLEKVVQKLAIIADLQTRKNMPQTTEDMRDEDLGILSMMHGKNIVEEETKNATSRKSCAVPRKKGGPLGVQSFRLEDYGVSQETFSSWGFNPLPLTKAQRTQLAVFTISRFHDAGDGFFTHADDVQNLVRFVAGIEKEYLPVPFHNFAHAVDVVHAVARIMRLTSSENFLTELEQYSLLIAASAHDLGHPGVNNGFLSEVGHELALQYNDRSPLENMHCAKLYTICSNPTTNVFQSLSKEQYKEVRKNCIETILHTDMMVHQAMVKDLQMTFQMNMEVFAPLKMQPDGVKPVPHTPGLAEIEVFAQPETKILIMDCILHSADVGNPCKTWDTTHSWALVCLEEFFAQGDQEKMLGIPVQFLNDRDKLNRPNSQIGFIEFMIAPFFAAQIRLWPAMHELGENLGNNLAQWADMWEADTKPGDEEKAKVQARVEKAKDNLHDAITRGGHKPENHAQ